MPGSGNFTSVTLGPEGGADVLKVNGESRDDIDAVEKILVVIGPDDVAAQKVDSTDDPPALPTASVKAPAGQNGWTVRFSSKQAPFAVGDTVLVTGVMTSDDSDEPFVWQQARRVRSDTDPANVG
jgi:hypothetical protein